MTVGRRDAFLYLAAATLGSFGLGVAAFYLNFLYRSLGYNGVALGALVGAAALGVVIGAVPAATIPDQPPSPDLPLGSDDQGRDMLAVLVAGVPLTLRVGFIAIGHGGRPRRILSTTGGHCPLWC